jgi:hypothetical protein
MCPLSFASPLRQKCVPAELNLLPDRPNPWSHATDPGIMPGRGTHNRTGAVDTDGKHTDGNHTGMGRRRHGG